MLSKRVLIILLFFCGFWVSAQDFSPLSETATGLGSAVTQSHAMEDVFRDVYGTGSSKTRAGAVKKNVAVSVDAAYSQLSYTPTPAETSAAIKNYVTGSNVTGAAATRARQALERAGIGQLYRDMVAASGLRDGNVADAFTAYSVLGWMVANKAPEPSRAIVQGTRNKFALQLAANPSLSGSHAAAVGEELKILFVMLYAAWQDDKQKGNEQAYSDAINSSFSGQGLNMRTLRLTTAGFAFR